MGYFVASCRLHDVTPETTVEPHECSPYEYPIDNPGKSIGGHRSSITVSSVATSVSVTVFAVATDGLSVGHRRAVDERCPKVGYH